jgi:hypothetical protein
MRRKLGPSLFTALEQPQEKTFECLKHPSGSVLWVIRSPHINAPYLSLLKVVKPLNDLVRRPAACGWIWWFALVRHTQMDSAWGKASGQNLLGTLPESS